MNNTAEWIDRQIESRIPALQDVGGSFCKSFSSLRILFEAIEAHSGTKYILNQVIKQ